MVYASNILVILNEFSRKKLLLSIFSFNMFQIVAFAAIISLNVARIHCIRFVFCENILVFLLNYWSKYF